MATKITDVSSNNLHLDNIGTVMLNTEGLTSFYQFDATNHLEYADASANEFQISGSEGFVADNGLTMMCWARNNNNPPVGNNIIGGKDDTGTPARQYSLFVNAANMGCFVSTTGSTVTLIVTPISAIDASEWNFYCLRWIDGQALSMFVNDTEYTGGVVNAPLFTGTAKFAIGANYASGVAQGFFDGDISLFGLYPSGWSNDQVLTLYEMTAPLFKSSL